jgi:hypothetical protein
MKKVFFIMLLWLVLTKVLKDTLGYGLIRKGQRELELFTVVLTVFP